MNSSLLSGIAIILLLASCSKSAEPLLPDSYFYINGRKYNTATVAYTNVGLSAYDSTYPLSGYHGLHIVTLNGTLREGSYRVVDTTPGPGEVALFTDGPEPLYIPGYSVNYYATGLDTPTITVSKEAGKLRTIIPSLWVRARFVGPPYHEDSFKVSADLRATE